jgi:hypothetical protein
MVLKLRTEGPEIETAQITRWCQTVVKPLVRQVIDTHDTDHVEIDQLLEEAKKDWPATGDQLCHVALVWGAFLRSTRTSTNRLLEMATSALWIET